ncbi:MAG: hypothetical protein ACHQ7N_00335 [Candidatus Methylomirabilales bacterium]
MAKKAKPGEKLPGPFKNFTNEFPAVIAEYDAMGRAAHAGGPLDAKTRELFKRGMAIGARLEGATHSHVCKAIGEEQSKVSKHLGILRRAGILFARRDGGRVMYRLKDTGVSEFLRKLHDLVPADFFCTGHEDMVI